MASTTARERTRPSPGADGDITSGNMHTFRTAPRRMFLGDIPPFIDRTTTTDAKCGNDDDVDYCVRLMGVVVEIMRNNTRSSSDIICRDVDHRHANDETSTINESPAAHAIHHFVMDDGTGSIEVITEGRIDPTDCTGEVGIHTPFARSLPPATRQQSLQSTEKNRHFPQHAIQPSPTTALGSILSSSSPPILLGQTVDCIGRIRVNSTETENETKTSPSHGIWLVASSVSNVNSPREFTLRNIQLSLSPRWKPIDHERMGNDVAGNARSQKNRILVGGYLERKLNPLYHCDHQGSVVFDMEEALKYIKHSKDDGGITQKEISSLVGAVEPNEVLAVNLAVERLREDCRIYNSQGKWFPM